MTLPQIIAQNTVRKAWEESDDAIMDEMEGWGLYAKEEEQKIPVKKWINPREKRSEERIKYYKNVYEKRQMAPQLPTTLF